MFKKQKISLRNRKIGSLFFEIPGVINYNSQDYVEVQPGVMTPLVINIKSTLSYFNIRAKFAKELVKQVNPESICICGVESGGSYYASAVADMLEKPLVLFRKKNKEYGIDQRFVGSLPDIKGGLVTIIDDVIGEGKISASSTKTLINFGYKVEICAIFDYLPKMKKFMSTVKIVSLLNIHEFCKIGKEINYFTEKDVSLIKKECCYSSRYKKI